MKNYILVTDLCKAIICMEKMLDIKNGKLDAKTLEHINKIRGSVLPYSKTEIRQACKRLKRFLDRVTNENLPAD